MGALLGIKNLNAVLRDGANPLANVRSGIGRKDDIPPVRLLTQDRGTGGPAGNLPQPEKMLAEYCELRGSDDEGIPKPERLEDLGLPAPALQQ